MDLLLTQFDSIMLLNINLNKQENIINQNTIKDQKNEQQQRKIKQQQTQVQVKPTKHAKTIGPIHAKCGKLQAS